ncbi:hypothetical protein [Candidatus Enterococcus ferrettii]|uniref:Uncharacterized protein n=1 Tax=Candidatus Enterococcus ferrettii TaxID=2815324 RepID=A0ABV0EQ33_9ENTE|nr:hypothetical protein [Enterococcus sp. 665A]MBO1341353.1 hypothetical protein [Enterococcus sp. 665A]
MFDEEKVLIQFKSLASLVLFLLMINTIGVIVPAIMSLLDILNVFTEVSFYMWGFITLFLWILTIRTFKQADIKISLKK